PGADGEVVLDLAPSLAAGLRGGLGYLETFPYACTEQTVSAFLPNAVTYRLYKQLGVDDNGLKVSLEQNLAAGLQRLYAMQGLDGGWGWWANDPSQPYLTAYVVQGLGEAVKAGYGVDQATLTRGLDYLHGVLDQGRDQEQKVPVSSQLNTRAYILFVLGELGQPDRGRTVALFEQREQLDHYGRAYLLMAFKSLGDDTRAAAIAGDLGAAAIMRPTDAHWEETRPDYATMGSDTRTTALALQALVRTDPKSALVPNAVRYLMGLRERDHWRTTQETAVTLMALAEYVAQSGELDADYSYRVALDDGTLREGSVGAGNLGDPVSVLVRLADLAQGTNAALSIQRQAVGGQSGKGRLYYTLRMRVYQDAAVVQALDQGVGVERVYGLVDTDTLSPTGELTTQATLGEVVQVRLTLTVPEDMPYFMVEDMLPAGLEALDTSLKTTSALADDPGLGDTGVWPAWWYFGRTEVRDNRVALFATDLPRGTYTYTYLARATTPGAFQTLPATAMRTYAPEVFGRSAGSLFTVTAP
ncbi:MAG: alpha-2-macroglobulin, partial [Desulfuromonadaceae bacterium]